ncbi:uncharacterized protein LOC115071589 [Nannospalax galili]|uniref:uncharacterized protein LOC115071589 n=1 Tax=Nannospalax galili TaxID=1026970 RepID=UPI00111C79F4|nr:uncharacterized protein LOC115071589 [Nannospalax galili]
MTISSYEDLIPSGALDGGTRRTWEPVTQVARSWRVRGWGFGTPRASTRGQQGQDPGEEGQVTELGKSGVGAGRGRNAGISWLARTAPGVRPAGLPSRPGLGCQVAAAPSSPHPPAPRPCPSHLRPRRSAAPVLILPPERPGPSVPRFTGGSRTAPGPSAARRNRDRPKLKQRGRRAVLLHRPPRCSLNSAPQGPAPRTQSQVSIGCSQLRRRRPLARGRRRRRGGTLGGCYSRNAAPRHPGFRRMSPVPFPRLDRRRPRRPSARLQEQNVTFSLG